MKYEAVVELEVALGPVDPTHREEYKIFEGLANAVNHAIVDEIPYHEALEGVALVKVRILKPGQGYIYNPSGLTGKTEEIVGEPITEPAAAGEEQVFSAGPLKIRAAAPHPCEEVIMFALVTTSGYWVKECGRYTASFTGVPMDAARFPTIADAFFAVDQCEALVWSEE